MAKKITATEERQVVAATIPHEQPFSISISISQNLVSGRIVLERTQTFTPAFWVQEDRPLRGGLGFNLSKCHKFQLDDRHLNS